MLYLIVGILVVAAVLVALIALPVWRRERRLRAAESYDTLPGSSRDRKQSVRGWDAVDHGDFTGRHGQ